MNVFLDFEKPIADFEGKIEELRQLGSKEAPKDGPRPAAVNLDDEIARLQAKTIQLMAEI